MIRGLTCLAQSTSRINRKRLANIRRKKLQSKKTGARRTHQVVANPSADSSAPQTWIVGSLSLPRDLASPHVSELIIWLSEDGYVLNADPCDDIDSDKLILSLEATVAKPKIGNPGWPAVIRTASDKFGAWLKSHLGSRVLISIEATPEIESTSRLVLDFGNAADNGASRPSYLTTTIDVEQMAQFFENAARLYVTQPWRLVKSDTEVFSVCIPAIDVKDAAVIVIGQSQQSYGLLVFADYGQYNQYVSLAKAHAAGARVAANIRFVSLNYEHARDLDPSLREEVKRFGWKVAGPTAYPWPICVEENWATRPLSSNELVMLGVLSHALVQFLEDRRRFRTASVTKAKYSARYHLDYLGKPVDVELDFPHPAEGGDDAA